WDTAGQEKFKCIASAYYRGAQVIITVFDLADIRTLGHAKRWLEDAMMENDTDAASISLFLVGMKKDLLSDAELHRMETDAVRIANEMGAEYWSVSAKTGENVKDFFLRAATLAFEKCILAAMDENSGRNAEIGSLLRIERTALDTLDANGQANPNCC
ncbi:ras-related protein Rab-36-like, partial [Sceloporus undulatus]|uniref:ras-related protein Rab-36-like n=1 Tax=Sceloporus undulatus TaxID=8520 RepID=UPI001C4CF8D3